MPTATPTARAAALEKLAELSADLYPKLGPVLLDAARRLRAGVRLPTDLARQVVTDADVPAELTSTALKLLADPTGYPNPKVEALMAHVGDFEPRDFLDAALAMLDQSCLRTATFNRAYEAVEKVIAEETPEGEEPTVDMAVAEKTETLSQGQLFVARAHFDLLRAISEGAVHGIGTTPGARDLLDAGLVLSDQGLAEMTPAGARALAAVKPEGGT
jgi:hypothetical protein